MFDKRYQVQRTFFTVKNFPNSVDAAMPNKYLRNKIMYDLKILFVYLLFNTLIPS
jgi:hypothetical protein